MSRFESPSDVAADQSKTYLWCDTCRRSYRHEDTTDGVCPVCGTDTRPMGKFSAIVRGLMSNELAASPLETRHRQLIRLIWTANGMGERYYRALEPDMSYNRFEAKVTELLCRGAEDGWVRFVIPPAPRPDESAYRLELDEDRFVSALHELVGAGTATEQRR
jgi:hypothetical protein